MKIHNVENNRIAIDTPYNPKFVQAIKMLGAKWNPSNKMWSTDARNIDEVRNIMMDIYGCDDRPTELVDIEVVTSKELSKYGGPVTLFSRVIASAFGRDSGAKMGEGVSIFDGYINSSGSVKNWKTIITEGTRIIIRDLPKRVVDEKMDWDDSYGTFRILPKKEDEKRKALEAEKEAILKRLGEIEEELSK
jgi:hypothetical protein